MHARPTRSSTLSFMHPMVPESGDMRRRWLPSEAEKTMLEMSYDKDAFPSAVMRAELARCLSIDDRQVQKKRAKNNSHEKDSPTPDKSVADILRPSNSTSKGMQMPQSAPPQSAPSFTMLSSAAVAAAAAAKAEAAAKAAAAAAKAATAGHKQPEQQQGKLRTKGSGSTGYGTFVNVTLPPLIDAAGRLGPKSKFEAVAAEICEECMHGAYDDCGEDGTTVRDWAVQVYAFLMRRQRQREQGESLYLRPDQKGFVEQLAKPDPKPNPNPNPHPDSGLNANPNPGWSSSWRRRCCAAARPRDW